MSRTIRVDPEVRGRIYAAQLPGEAVTDTVRRLIGLEPRLPECFDVPLGVCHECDRQLAEAERANRLEVTVHDDSGFHPAVCAACSDCWATLTQPVDPKAARS